MRKKGALSFCLSLLIVLGLAVTASAVKIKVIPTKATITVGSSKTVRVSGTKKKAKWSTSNKAIATVSSKGKIIANKPGSVTITAKVGKNKAKCKITVPKMKINASKASVNVGASKTLKVANASNIKWSTSNKAVVTVSSKGKITGKKAGTATITAKAGKTKVTCKVTVKQTAPKFSVDVDYGTDYTYQTAYTLLDFTNKDSEPLYVGAHMLYDNVDLMSYLTDTVISKNILGYAEADLEFQTVKREGDSKYILVKRNENDLINYNANDYITFDRNDSIIKFSVAKGNVLYWYKYDCLLDKVSLTSQRSITLK